MAEPQSDAREMDAPSLLRAAGRLIERALIKLDMREKPCGECGYRHFHNKLDARIYERFSNSPSKLNEAADELDTAAGRRPTPPARRRK